MIWYCVFYTTAFDFYNHKSQKIWVPVPVGELCIRHCAMVYGMYDHLELHIVTRLLSCELHK